MTWEQRSTKFSIPVGKVGMKIELDLEVVYRSPWGNVSCIFRDETGNEFVWSPSRALRAYKGNIIRIRGKIVSHEHHWGNTYSTRLKYCRIIKRIK